METKKTYFVTGEDLKKKRTQFLRARCAESQYFGMKNIASWLMLEREHDRPRDIETWTWIIKQNADMVGSDVGEGPLSELLNSFGLRLDEVTLSQDELPSIGDFQGIRDFIDTTIGIFDEPFITDSGLFFISQDEKSVMRFEGSKNGGTYTAGILRSDVLMSALLSWKYGNGQHQALLAKHFLCSWLERRIQYVLDEGGKEFDVAMAVTEDGAKIVPADRVVLSRLNQTFQMYEKDLFAKRKILQQSNLVRDNVLVEIALEVTRENILAAFKGRFNSFMGPVSLSVLEHWQKYFTVKMPSGKVEKWLWCHIGEDNFPEGGTTFKL